MRMTFNCLLLLISTVVICGWVFLVVPLLSWHPIWLFAVGFLIGQSLAAWTQFHWREA